MGAGTYTSSSFADYSKSVGRSYDKKTGRSSGQVFRTTELKRVMDPHDVIRECANSDEHPNTVPVILGLDVTGSMGSACRETAEALGTIMKSLFNKFKDVEFCVMGIGDFEYDNAPLQVSQFESDVRIAQSIDNLYMERGGGGNNYESYTAPWAFGLYRTKLDAFDKQGRKGIIITMGDEPLNPDLPREEFLNYIGKKSGEIGSLKTKELYKNASKKFDIFHIAVDDGSDSYESYKNRIESTFRPILGDRLKISTINNLSKTIVDCISESINGSEQIIIDNTKKDENGDIVW